MPWTFIWRQFRNRRFQDKFSFSKITCFKTTEFFTCVKVETKTDRTETMSVITLSMDRTFYTNKHRHTYKYTHEHTSIYRPTRFQYGFNNNKRADDCALYDEPVRVLRSHSRFWLPRIINLRDSIWLLLFDPPLRKRFRGRNRSEPEVQANGSVERTFLKTKFACLVVSIDTLVVCAYRRKRCLRYKIACRHGFASCYFFYDRSNRARRRFSITVKEGKKENRLKKGRAPGGHCRGRFFFARQQWRGVRGLLSAARAPRA